MTAGLVEKVAKAVLYEGYILYPYRPSSVKNRRRFNFGVLAPQAYSVAQRGTEAYSLQTECLVLGGAGTRLDVRARFLHLRSREVSRLTDGDGEGGAPEYRAVESLEVDGQVFHTWQEALEREALAAGLDLDALAAEPRSFPFSFPGVREIQPLSDADGRIVGALAREQQSVEGSIEVAAERLAESSYRVTVRIANTTAFEDEGCTDREEALTRSLVSAHAVLEVWGGEFVSMLEPPDELREAVAGCSNVGVWPVLVGEAGERAVMLASPIILYDYPKIAPESAGDLFDGTEIDEILTLRIMTLTEDEKREMRDVDERARQILERTETMPAEQFMKLHGALRGLRAMAEEN